MPRAPTKPLPPLERLRDLFAYDPETGALTWKARPVNKKADAAINTRRAGTAAGSLTKRGYLTVGIGYAKYYLAHRIVWKLMTGDEPTQVDHRDGDRINNRWLNLRAADNSTNLMNSKLRSDNKSGVKGVFWDAPHKAWRAVITANGKSERLGRFATVEQAAEVINARRIELHGEFARLN